MSEEEIKAIEHLEKMKEYRTIMCMNWSDAEILLKLIEKQQKEIESNKQMIDELNFRYNIEHSKNLSKKELIEQQQKELEELKKENFDTVYIQAIENYKTKIRAKIKELEENVKDFEEYWSKDPRKFKKENCIDYYKLEALKQLLEE